jgi:hypothetical protein
MTRDEQKAILLPLMREMWRRLEAVGVALITGPEEQIVILRKPTIREFREIATAAGVPDPRSWAKFYELTFEVPAPGAADAAADGAPLLPS